MLDREQDLAAVAVNRWLKECDKQVFHLFGYAGTGKTFIAKYIAENVEGEVIFCAFTWKAVQVLKSKGCENAQTIHSLIYRSRDRSKAELTALQKRLEVKIASLGEVPQDIIDYNEDVIALRDAISKEKKNADQPLFILNEESEITKYALVILDECSMVDGTMAQDLLSFGVPVLALGDPAQLPPVAGQGYFTDDVNPDIMLTNIHRQAKDSAILTLATMAREGKMIKPGMYDNVEVRAKNAEKMSPDTMLLFDQLICGRNKSRKAFNKKMRQIKGVDDPYPVQGDKVIALTSNADLGIYNGNIYDVTSCDGVMDAKVSMTARLMGETLSTNIICHEHHFLGKEDELNWYEKSEALSFDYAEAITCHKAQGSQWKNVCVFDEAFCFRDKADRWRYTAITRAEENLIIQKM